MKNKKHLDKIKRNAFKHLELKQKLFKLLTILTKDNSNLIVSLLFINKSISNKSYFTKVKNRCTITGRSFATYSKYKLSRIMIKKLISSNDLIGFYKDSW